MRTLKLAQGALFLVAALGVAAFLSRPCDSVVEPDPEPSTIVDGPVQPTDAKRIAIAERALPPVVVEVEPELAPRAELVAESVPAAFDGGPTRSLSGLETSAWLDGRRHFAREWTADEGLGGPGFNAESCGTCHKDPVAGGAGDNEFNVIVQVGERYEEWGTRFTGNRLTSLRRQRERFQQALADIGGVPTPEVIAAQFPEIQTPTLQGLGRIAAIQEQAILARADPHDADGNGIRGVARQVKVGERGKRTELGRFGWKARTPLLSDFVCMALAGETGITVPDQGRGFGLARDGDEVQDPELSQADFDDLVFFVSNVAPPERGERGRAGDPEVFQGEHLFTRVGCADCHVPSLPDRHGRPVTLYSDLLLHEVLPALPDNEELKRFARVLRFQRQRSKEPQEPAGFRTPPLWGIGKTAPYLHDGRATTLHEAILAHQLEAETSRTMYESLREADQRALVAFLNDL